MERVISPNFGGGSPTTGAWQLVWFGWHRCQPAWMGLCCDAQHRLAPSSTMGRRGTALGMTGVSLLFVRRGGKCSPASQLVFWSPAFTFSHVFLGEPELLLVVVLFCKSPSSLAD